MSPASSASSSSGCLHLDYKHILFIACHIGPGASACQLPVMTDSLLDAAGSLPNAVQPQVPPLCPRPEPLVPHPVHVPLLHLCSQCHRLPHLHADPSHLHLGWQVPSCAHPACAGMADCLHSLVQRGQVLCQAWQEFLTRSQVGSSVPMQDSYLYVDELVSGVAACLASVCLLVCLCVSVHSFSSCAYVCM